MDDIAIERLNEPIEEIAAANSELIGELEEIMGKLSVLIESAEGTPAEGTTSLNAEAIGDIVSAQLSETVQSLRDVTAVLLARSDGDGTPTEAGEQLVQQQMTIERLQRTNRGLKAEIAELHEQSDQMIQLLTQQQQLIDQADSMANSVRKLQQSLTAKARSEA